MDIFKWTPDSEPIPGVWVVDKTEIEEFDVVRELFEEYPIYSLRHDHPHAFLAYFLLSLEHSDRLICHSDACPSASDLGATSTIIASIRAINSLDAELAQKELEILYELAQGSPKFDKVIFFIETLNSIISSFCQALCFNSIYGFITQKRWWEETPAFCTQLPFLEREVGKLPPPFREKAMKVLNGIKSNLMLLKSRKAGDVVKVVSAYCYSIVPFMLNNNAYLLAYMLIHRALDFFYAGTAMDLGLIIIKRDFISYYDKNPYQDDERQRISLWSTCFEYISKTAPLGVEAEEIVRRVNKKRNGLLLTHGVDSVSECDSKKAYTDAGRVMKKDENWKQYLDNFKFAIRVNECEALHFFFDLGNVVVKI